jgi:hypothetical protein
MFLCNLVDVQQTIWRYIPDDRTFFYYHRCENLKRNIILKEDRIGCENMGSIHLAHDRV